MASTRASMAKRDTTTEEEPHKGSLNMKESVRNRNLRHNKETEPGKVAFSQRYRAVIAKGAEAFEKVPKQQLWQAWDIFREIENLPKIPEI